MSKQNDIFVRFEQGTLDLPSAFWLFGVVASFIVGFVGAFIAELLHWIVYIPVFVILFGIIGCLYSCAENYIKDKEKKKPECCLGLSSICLLWFKYCWSYR